MKYDYTKEKILINQNFIPKNIVSNEIYDWDRVCIFRHDPITKKNTRNIMKYRCQRMREALRNNKVLLVNMTKIVDDPEEETHRLLNLIYNYDIRHEIFIVMFTTCVLNLGLFNYNNINIYRVLVDNFNLQNEQYGIDNVISVELGKDILNKINELYIVPKKDS